MIGISIVIGISIIDSIRDSSTGIVIIAIVSGGVTCIAWLIR